MGRWIKTTDHKDIGMMYIVIGIISGIIGMGYSMVMRAELITGEKRIMEGQVYNVIITYHGIVMLIIVAMAIVVGGIGNYLVPIMVGAADMSYPRMNNISIWVLVMGIIVMGVAGVIEEGPGIGWTMYAPLSMGRIHSSVSVDSIIISVHLAGISSIMGAINIIVTIVNMRGGGMKMEKVGLMVWAMLVTAILIIGAIPVLAAAVTMLLSDRNLNTSIIESGGGGDSVLIAHIIWIIGHPEVYILIIPVIGIVSQIVSGVAGKEVIGKVGMVWAMISIGVLGNIVWAHHMITIGLDVKTNTYITAATMMIGIPTGIKIISWIATMYGGGKGERKTPEMIVRGIIVLITMGGVTGIILANRGVNVAFHDGYIVVGHIHIVLSIGLMIGVIGGVYYWIKMVVGVNYGEEWGKVHIWLIIIGVNITIIPMHILGYNGMPRRYPQYADALTGWNQVVTYGSVISMVSVIVIMVGVWEGIVKKEEEGRGEKVERIRSNEEEERGWWGRSMEICMEMPPREHNIGNVPKM